MARYDLHPIGHDGSIEREREREAEIDKNFTVLPRRTKRLCRRLIGRSVAERERALLTSGREGVGSFSFCACVCVFLVYVL